MKKIFLSAVVLSLFSISCQNKKSEVVTTEETTTIQTPDSTTVVTKTETQTTVDGTIITKNEGKYPTALKVFEDKDFNERFKKLTGKQYDEIIRNFNVETPIVSEAGIYKFTGCLQHNCPGYQTTVLFDAKNDNLNVIVDQNGKIQEFTEKGKINYTDALKMK